jgi:hypothetical protein
MVDLDNPEHRKARLLAELDQEIAYAESKAVANHRFSLILMGMALCCSVAAGAIGVFTTISSKVVGGIAVLPPLIAYFAVNLKLQPKSDWHYRKSYGLQALRSRLLFQLPANPSVENIAAIASARDKLNIEMLKEWRERLGLNLEGLAQGQGPKEPQADTPRHP